MPGKGQAVETSAVDASKQFFVDVLLSTPPSTFDSEFSIYLVTSYALT
jgi:hypothetical protein